MRVVVDAGVVLARLDPRRRGHTRARRLLKPGEAGALIISAVNLAEALQHARDWQRATGADLVAVLDALGVAVHSPGASVAAAAAELATEPALSLADRFVVATALAERARLWTTDPDVEAAARRARVPVTRI